jgi:ABC-type multidrug transport system fused ATPase/permease subunit
LFDIAEFTSTSAVMLIMLRSLIYGQQLQQSASILVEKTPFLQSLDDTHLQYLAGRHKRGDIVVKTLDSVQLNDLCFAYRDGTPALSDLSLEIPAGEIVGIVGPSGSGKSTLVEILLGLRIPDRGTVLINGHDLQSITHESWSTISAFVPQETALITGTISENIRFFRPDISDEDVIRAARHAFIDSVVKDLPDGYESWIGERGAELSGGQRQRLAIARAIVGRPQLLILDEPTSALDSQSEEMVRKALADLSKGDTTVVVVAHRMSTLSICDRVLVLQDGRRLVFEETSRVLDPQRGYASVLQASKIG